MAASLRQFQDLLIVVLLIAAVVNLVVTREWNSPVVIVLVVLLNATIGFVEESKAEASLEADGNAGDHRPDFRR